MNMSQLAPLFRQTPWFRQPLWLRRALRLSLAVLLALSLAACEEDSTEEEEEPTPGGSTAQSIRFNDQTLSISEHAQGDPLCASCTLSAAIVGGTGELNFAAQGDTAPFTVSSGGAVTLQDGQRLNFEDENIPNAYEFDVTASAADAEANPDLESVTAKVSINVTNATEVITFVDQTIDLPEDAVTNPPDPLPTVEASVNDGSALTFAFAEGQDSNPALTTFAIDAETGALSTVSGAILDFEELQGLNLFEFAVTVTATDALARSAMVTVNVTNVTEIIVFEDQTVEVPEGSDTNQPDPVVSIVGSVNDGTPIEFGTFTGDTFTGGLTQGPFVISASGEITYATGGSVDFDVDGAVLSYTLSVSSNAAGADSVRDVQVEISVVNVPDLTITLAALTIADITEGVDPTTLGPVNDGVLATANATITETTNDTIVYALDEASAAFFAIDASGGAITALEALDFEEAASHEIVVTASAMVDGSSAEQTVTVTVIDVQDGSADEPYKVGTLAELQSIATGFANDLITTALTSDASLLANYVQVADIDASDTADDTYDSSSGSTGGAAGSFGFLPIGSCDADPATDSSTGTDTDTAACGENVGEAVFSGSYDGQGFIISGLTIRDDCGETTPTNCLNGVGMFAISSGEMRGMILKAASIGDDDSSGANSGVLVGYTSGDVLDVQVHTSSLTGGASTGGLAGYTSGDMDGIWLRGNDIDGGSNTGGAAGAVADGSTLTNVVIQGGRVAGGNNTGGLVGTLGGSLSASFATATVSGNILVGGAVGELISSGTVDTSFATGSATGSTTASNTNVGGFAGDIYGSADSVFSLGNARGTRHVGGFVGRARTGSTVTNVFSRGLGIGNSGYNPTGGFVGQSIGASGISNGYVLGTAERINGEGVESCTMSGCGIGGYTGNGDLASRFYLTSVGREAHLSTPAETTSREDIEALQCGGAGDAAPIFRDGSTACDRASNIEHLPLGFWHHRGTSRAQ